MSCIDAGLSIEVTNMPVFFLWSIYRDREQEEFSASHDELLSSVSQREAQRLRECLEEAQRALTEGSMDDESVRAQIEDQLGLYRRLVSEQERRLMEHMR